MAQMNVGRKIQHTKASNKTLHEFKTKFVKTILSTNIKCGNNCISPDESIFVASICYIKDVNSAPDVEIFSIIINMM